jgi:CDP-diacylglycerol--serine O-phosphatidyltransferase
MNFEPKQAEQHAENVEKPEKTPQRGIYLLPNLLTTAALFAAFYSMIAAMKGHFEIAAITIFVAIIADGLDGRVARLTNTQTPFGAQYDSLSDMAAFGIAPALAIYSWSLFSLGKLGWFAAFLYVACTTLRLARFNTQATDKQYFQGLSSTAAAGLMASIVWLGADYEVAGTTIAISLAFATIVIAALMVSTIRYSSFKSIDFKGRVPFFTVVVAVFVIAAISLEPAEMLFAVFFTYACAGPLMTLWQLRKVRKQRMLEQHQKARKRS